MQERATIVEDKIDVEQAVRNYERLICEALNQKEVAEVRQLVLEVEDELDKSESSSASPMRRGAAEVLRRARRLPVGPDRNELRQIALALLWLEEKGLSLRALCRVADPSKSGPTQS